MTDAIKLTVNAANLVRHLRNAFTRTDTVLAELMQNARRAGATSVAFQCDETTRTLSVEDNGRGLEDPQAMFSIGESGWDTETMTDERPYGLGFMAAIYAAERVVIASRGRRIDIDTGDLLDFQDIDVVADADGPAQGARITLQGWTLGNRQTKDALASYARGFPIPVLCNGEPLPRPDAIDGGRVFTDTEVGKLCVHAIEQPLHAGARALGVHRQQVYLQGLPISIGAGSREETHNVVHLDPRRFTGRMPDRSTLVNQDEAAYQIRETVENAWKARLRGLKAELSAEDFAALAYPTVRLWGCLELFDDVEDLPPQVLSIADAYPLHRLEWEDGNSAYTGPPVSRRHIVAGLVRVGMLPDGFGDDEGEGWKAEMYAYLHKAIVFDEGLPESHWLHGLLTEVSKELVTVTLVGADPEVSFIGNILWKVPVVVCDHYVLDGPLGRVTGYVPWYGCSDAGAPVLVFPRESQRIEVVRQVDEFWDGQAERYLETEQEQEEARLFGFIRSRIPGQHAAVLRALLADLDLRSYPGLHGGRFEVHIGLPDGDGRPTITVKPIDNPE